MSRTDAEPADDGIPEHGHGRRASVRSSKALSTWLRVSNPRTRARAGHLPCALALLLWYAGAGYPAAQPVSRDICEGKAGPELIRCIEAAAHGTPQSSNRGAPKTAERATTPPGATPTPRGTPAVAAEDCTGRQADELRRCLAAGGRLQPSAAVVSGAERSAPPVIEASCESLTGDALRRCVEAGAREPSSAPRTSTPQLLDCRAYTAADQPLCLHRNLTLSECRNRQKYPDFDLCVRNLMRGAPEPARADCGKLGAGARAHCEARNRVYGACSADKLAYFGCLRQKLGADAMLPTRPAAAK